MNRKMNQIIFKFTMLVLGFAAISFAAPQTGTMTDSRDGQTYKTVQINDQTWMAENLNYEAKDSYCYNDCADSCQKYGRFYTWATASDVCPSGWRLPSEDDWLGLFENVGNKKSRLMSNTDWADVRTKGSDEFSFSVLPAGYTTFSLFKNERVFGGKGRLVNGKMLYKFAFFWTSSECSSEQAKYVIFGDNAGSECDICCGGMNSDKANGYSVRCIKDNAQSNNTNIELVKGSFTDSRDGRTYKTVKIGNQVWMAENLKYGKGVCLNGKKSNCKKYGMLYGEKDAKKACPNGWHLPSAAEFKKLLNYAGRNAGKKLKAEKGWDKNGTDQFGFAALPGGAVGSGDGEPGNWYLGGATFFTSTIDENNNYGPQPFVLQFNEYNSDEVSIESMNGNIWGHSVRCIKD